MPIDMTPAVDHLVVRVTGEVDPVAAVDNFVAILAACRAHRLTRVFVDARAVTAAFAERLSTLPAVMQTLAQEQLATLGRGAGLFLAVVTPERPTPVASDAVSERAALDHGLAVFITDDPLDAYAWLQVEPPADPPSPA